MGEGLSHDEKLAKVREMVKEIDICMLTTLDDHGNLRSRPMSVNGEVEFDGDLWFFTYASSHKADDIGHVPKVNAAFADPDGQRYVSMSGRGQIVRDRERIEQLWQPILKAWFPKGTDEPDIALLKVTVETVEYWDSSQSAVAHAISLASALVSGEPAEPGENETLRLE